MNRKEILKQYWETAYKELSQKIPFDKVFHPSWLKEYRNTQEVIHEVSALAEMEINNLKMLNTEEGKKAYCDTLNFPYSIQVDFDNMNNDNNNGLLERTFLVQCTKEQLIALGDWMNEHDVFFNKCSDEINDAAHAYTFPEEAAETEETDGTVRP